MLMTSGGQSIRIRITDVRETGRNAQGVKLVTLNESESLQDIAAVRSNDEQTQETQEKQNTQTGKTPKHQ